MNPEVAPQEQSEERPRRGWTKVRARKAIGPMAASQTESERRDATRSNLCIPSNAKLKGHAEQIDCQEMITRKIHNRGAFFKTTSPFPLASELRLILDLASIWSGLSVRWCELISKAWRLHSPAPNCLGRGVSGRV